MKRVKGSRRKDASKAVFADTSDSYNGNIVYYFTTTGDTARDENKTVYSYLATGNTGLFKYQILPLFHNVRYKVEDCTGFKVARVNV